MERLLLALRFSCFDTIAGFVTTVPLRLSTIFWHSSQIMFDPEGFPQMWQYIRRTFAICLIILNERRVKNRMDTASSVASIDF